MTCIPWILRPPSGYKLDATLSIYKCRVHFPSITRLCFHERKLDHELILCSGFRFVSFWAQVFLSLQHHTSFDSIISIAIHGKETQFSAEAFILGSVFRSHFNPLLLTRNKSDAFPQCKVGSSHLQDRRRVLNKMPHAGHFFFQREGPMEAWQCVTVKIEASPTGHECTSVWAWQWHVV